MIGSSLGHTVIRLFRDLHYRHVARGILCESRLYDCTGKKAHHRIGEHP